MFKYKKEQYIKTTKQYTVYKGTTQNGQQVLLKLLSSSFSMSKNFEERFFKAQKLTELSHPNLTKYTDFYKDNYQYIIVQEYFEGEDFKQLLKKEKLTAERIRNYFLQILNAVKYLHEHDIINGHFELENFILTEQDNVLLDDYGLIPVIYGTFSHKEKGFSVAPPRYCTPEEIKGEQVNRLSDIYSLGVILYSLVEGSEPYFNIYSASDLARQIVEMPLPEISRFKFLQPIINKATEKNPADRFSGVDEFLAAIEQISFEEEPVKEKEKILVAQPEDTFETPQDEPKISQEVIREDEIIISSHNEEESQYSQITVTKTTQKSAQVEKQTSSKSSTTFTVKRDFRKNRNESKLKIGCLGVFFIIFTVPVLIIMLVMIIDGMKVSKHGTVYTYPEGATGYRIFQTKSDDLVLIATTKYNDSLLVLTADKESLDSKTGFSINISNRGDLDFDGEIIYKTGRSYNEDSAKYLPSLKYIYTNGTYEEYYNNETERLSLINVEDSLLNILFFNQIDSVYRLKVYDKMLNKIKEFPVLRSFDENFTPICLKKWNSDYVIEFADYSGYYIASYSNDGSLNWIDSLYSDTFFSLYANTTITNFTIVNDKLYFFSLDGQNINLSVINSNGQIEYTEMLLTDFAYPVINSVLGDSSGLYLAGDFNDDAAFVLKTDFSGNILWEKNFNSVVYFKFSDLMISGDTLFVIGGKEGFWDNDYSLYLLLLDKNGNFIN